VTVSVKIKCECANGKCMWHHCGAHGGIIHSFVRSLGGGVVVQSLLRRACVESVWLSNLGSGTGYGVTICTLA
jgi:hypothetical protein